MRLVLLCLLLLACDKPAPKAPPQDSAEVRLRDTSIKGLRELLEKAKSSDVRERDIAETASPAFCDKADMDKVMKDKKLEQEILDECAIDIPQIQAALKQHQNTSSILK